MLTEIQVYILVLVFTIGLLLLILYILFKQEEEIQNRPTHPYYCDNCLYETIGTIAAGGLSCPECGHLLKYNNADRLVARTWIATGKTTYHQWNVFHIYRKNNDSYEYVRTVLADTEDSAIVLAKQWYGELTSVIKNDKLMTDQFGQSFLPEKIKISKVPDVSISKRKDGKYEWFDGSDGQLNPEQIINNHIKKSVL